MSRVGAEATRPALYTPPLLAVCAVGLLGFASNFVIQPILPVLVLEQGGNATLVGLIIAVFSLPSVALRPLMGRLADDWSARLVLAAGMLVIATAGLAYLVPSLVVIFAVRVVHGTAWAAFNTGGHALVAHLAPSERRAEASATYSLMPGIAQMVMPAVGLVLLTSFGLPGPFVACALLGLAGLLIVVTGPVRETHTSEAGLRRAGEGASSGTLLESGAVLPMALEILFSLSFTLFLVFPPVFAAAYGIPLEDLTLYYPIYGGTLVVMRALTNRFLDRVPRGRVVASGAGLALVGLSVAAFADSVALLTVGAALYATAAAFTSPTLMAMAIDRSDPRRLGAAMATYTLGFQLAIGAGAALWGVVIDLLGYPAPYLVAVAVQLALLAVLLTWRRSLQDSPPEVHA